VVLKLSTVVLTANRDLRALAARQRLGYAGSAPYLSCIVFNARSFRPLGRGPNLKLKGRTKPFMFAHDEEGRFMRLVGLAFALLVGASARADTHGAGALDREREPRAAAARSRPPQHSC
jgi:hypothetical protein